MNLVTGEIVGILLFFVGLYGLMTKKAIIKTIMSLSIMEAGIYLFYITINYSADTVPPIGELQEGTYVDPLPSALMITAIVIGVGVTAIGLTMFMHYKQKYGITHWSRIKNKEGSDE